MIKVIKENNEMDFYDPEYDKDEPIEEQRRKLSNEIKSADKQIRHYKNIIKEIESGNRSNDGIIDIDYCEEEIADLMAWKRRSTNMLKKIENKKNESYEEDNEKTSNSGENFDTNPEQDAINFLNKYADKNSETFEFGISGYVADDELNKLNYNCMEVFLNVTSKEDGILYLDQWIGPGNTFEYEVDVDSIEEKNEIVDEMKHVLSNMVHGAKKWAKSAGFIIKEIHGLDDFNKEEDQVWTNVIIGFTKIIKESNKSAEDRADEIAEIIVGPMGDGLDEEDYNEIVKLVKKFPNESNNKIAATYLYAEDDGLVSDEDWEAYCEEYGIEE